MKRTLLLLWLLAWGIAPVGEVAAKVLLRMNHQFPATAAGSKIDQWFAEEVSRVSGGELEVRIYWSGALGEAKENLTLLQSGAIDLAAMSAGYYPAELPLFSAPNSIPMALDDICQSSALMQQLVEQVPAYMEEAAANRIRPLFFHVLNPYLLLTRKPVLGLDDLKGLKIRTWGEDMPLLVQAAGAVPVTIFLPELYENLQRGVIDGCPFSVDLALTYRLQEVAKHVSEVVLWEGPAWGVWIAEAAWQRLSRDQRQALVDVAERARRRELHWMDESARSARAALESAGVRFQPFPETDLARWRAASPDFLQRWIGKMDAVGRGEAAREAVMLWQRTRSTVRCD